MAHGEELTQEQVEAFAKTGEDARKVCEELLYLRARVSFQRANLDKAWRTRDAYLALLAAVLPGLDDYWVTTDIGSRVLESVEAETGLKYADLSAL